MLPNTIDFYRASIDRGLSGEPKFRYPTSPTIKSIPCSVQIRSHDSGLDETERLTEESQYVIYVAQPITFKPDDKLVWTDNAGIPRILFVKAAADLAGRGQVFSVLAVERR